MLIKDLKAKQLKFGAHRKTGRIKKSHPFQISYKQKRRYVLDKKFQTYAYCDSDWHLSFITKGGEFYGKGYAKELMEQKPLAYMELQEIDPGSEEGRALKALHAKNILEKKYPEPPAPKESVTAATAMWTINDWNSNNFSVTNCTTTLSSTTCAFTLPFKPETICIKNSKKSKWSVYHNLTKE